ncbi:hypothetical protein [Cupriavidus sp. CuC1]|uniref:hypothetical protein n=1 Tax=Cupriavidus sp. CuC1 TaxID=3373131 RepID=UPI0037CCD831
MDKKDCRFLLQSHMKVQPTVFGVASTLAFTPFQATHEIFRYAARCRGIRSILGRGVIHAEPENQKTKEPGIKRT